MEDVKLSYQSITKVIGYLSALSESNQPKNVYVTQEGKHVIDFKKIARTLVRIVDPTKHPLAQDIDKLCNF